MVEWAIKIMFPQFSIPSYVLFHSLEYRSHQNFKICCCCCCILVEFSLVLIPPPNLLVFWCSGKQLQHFVPELELLSQSMGSDVWSSLKQVSNHFFKLLLGQLVGASVSCWLLLQFYSLFIHGGLPIRQFYVLGTKNKCWSKSLPNDHTTLNNFRSLITEEIIRRNV